MRGTTLNVLIQMLRRELKIAESPSLGKNTRAAHAHALRSAQERLYDGFDWPFKIVNRDMPLSAGQRYYAPPADMIYEGIRDLATFYSGRWWPMKRGINEDNYNLYNSDAGARLDPVSRWQFFNDPDNGDMIEMWPIPASNSNVVRYRGTKKVSPLVADDDKADLDDLLLVYYAAVDFAQLKEVQRAEQKAQHHFFALKRNLSNTDTFVSGGGSDSSDRHFDLPRIVITPATTGG